MNRNDYIRRINAVVDYIQNHLDADLSLATLASVASFSPFHFHRLFKAFHGESLNDFVKRVRIERAASQLRFSPTQSVTDIALAYGFASVSTFSRAFSQHYGMSPSQFRRLNDELLHRNHGKAEGKNGKVVGKNGKDEGGSLSYDGITPVATELIPRRQTRMQVEVRTLQPARMAYVRHFTGFDKGVYNEELSNAFDKAANWMSAHDLFRAETLCVAATYGSLDVSQADRCLYDAGFTVPAETQAGDGVVGIQDLPGGLYAVARIAVANDGADAFVEAIRQMGQAVDELYGEWLPGSGYELDDRPCLELYLTPKVAPEIRIEYGLPIKTV